MNGALRHAIHILPDVMVTAMRADPFSVELFASLDEKLERAAVDLVWWAKALAMARAQSAPVPA